ncbi:MAG: VWA domain-containing protein [Thermoplasmata archaeon]
MRLRKDARGVASTIATILSLLLVVIIISAFTGWFVPQQMKENEYVHMKEATGEFERLKNTIDFEIAFARSLENEGEVLIPAQIYSTVTLGSEGIPALADPTPGVLTFDPYNESLSLEWRFVHQWGSDELERIDQDVVLIMDSSTSMWWNDPFNERLDAAERYIDNLEPPDRVAIVDFDHRSRLVRRNVGGDPHHLNHTGHGEDEVYGCAKDDIRTIDSWGRTNFGWAIHVANDELIANGDENHVWIEILLTDGRNNRLQNDTQALEEAQRAKDNGITIFTIGLGDENFQILQQIADVTDGRFYAAPDPSYLDWIYQDISNQFTGELGCACIELSHSSSGRVKLEVNNRYYVSQSLVYEHGAVVLGQAEGSIITSGPYLSIVQSTGGELLVDLRTISLIGESTAVSGTGSEGLVASLASMSTERYTYEETTLDGLDAEVESLQQDVQYRLDIGGVLTQDAGQSILQKLDEVEGHLESAIQKWGNGETEDALDQVRDALGSIDQTIEVVQEKENKGKIQDWYAEYLLLQLAQLKCNIGKWEAWIGGVSIVASTDYVNAWADWFHVVSADLDPNQYSVVETDHQAVLSLRRVAELRLEVAVVELRI